MTDLISTLNDLISTCLDSEEGFRKAAKGVHAEEWRTRFTDTAEKRARFAGEIAAEVRRVGGQPVKTPHFGGILRPGWVDLEGRIRPKNDQEFIADCARGEEGTLKHYYSALNRAAMPDETRGIIEAQIRDIERTVAMLRGEPLTAGR
jgi:uncharacterized protein (TIGR02284 family)